MQQAPNLTGAQTVSVTCNPVDASGNPAALEAGAAQVAPVSSNPACATVTADPTGLILTVQAVAPGTTNITVTGTNTSGGTFTTSFGELVLSGNLAAGFIFAFGTPQGS